MRGRMRAEAAERGRPLAEAMEPEEDGRASVEELTKGHGVAFVLHREGAAETLEGLAGQGDRLVSVAPRKGGEATTAGLEGAWPVFERSG